MRTVTDRAMDRLRRTRVHLTDGSDDPKVEYRITYTSRDRFENDEGQAVEELHHGTMVVDEAALEEWATGEGDLTVEAVERRLVPSWETVPTHQWPEGLHQ